MKIVEFKMLNIHSLLVCAPPSLVPCTPKGFMHPRLGTTVVDLGDEQILEHSFEILTEREPTCILGRDFLKKFGTTEFNWAKGQVRLGNIWKTAHMRIEGGEPLSRASVATLDILDHVASMQDLQSHYSIEKSLSDRQRLLLTELLNKHPEAFATNSKRPNPANGTKHRIITGDAQPIMQRPYPVSPEIEKEINRQLEEMLINDICRPSDSPWASRVLLVTKRDGSKGFVVDYRPLNKVTQTDSYPMPNPRDILDRLHGDTYFSTLDCASAYWAIEIPEEDRHKTAFVYTRGLFEMNRMPFGLVNSQSSYERLMDTTLRHVDHAEPYIDDICIHSSTFEQHLIDLESTLQALEKANIQLRVEKCKFAFKNVEFIGHVISESGHSPTPNLLDKQVRIKIRNVQTPRGKKELQRFLGLANLYRDHVPGYAQIAEPLYRLTQRSQVWDLDDAAQEAYRKLKRSRSASGTRVPQLAE